MNEISAWLAELEVIGTRGAIRAPFQTWKLNDGYIPLTRYVRVRRPRRARLTASVSAVVHCAVSTPVYPVGQLILKCVP